MAEGAHPPSSRLGSSGRMIYCLGGIPAGEGGWEWIGGISWMGEIFETTECIFAPLVPFHPLLPP